MKTNKREAKFNPQGVMGRMEWFRDLRRIFNKYGSNENRDSEIDINSAPKSSVLEELVNRAHKLELQDPNDINPNQTGTNFSFEEVYNCLQSSDCKMLSWDRVIDLLISLSVTKKGRFKKLELEKRAKTYKISNFSYDKQYEKVEVTPCTIEQLSCILDQANVHPKPYQTTLSTKDIRYPVNSYSSIEANSSISISLSRCSSSIKILCPDPENFEEIDSMNSYDLSFPTSKTSIVPESKLRKFGNSLLYLSLAGNLLTHTKWEFPDSIVILNLASNEIQEFSLGSNLFNLRLLNLSINRIKTITNLHKIKSLSELYAGYNCLQNLNTLCKLEKLKILDIQHNNITSFEEIAILSVNPKLTTLAIKGNPIESRLNFLSTLKSILPKIYNLNPISIFEYSDFKDFGYMPFIPLKKPPEQVKQYRSLGPEEVSGSSKVRKPSKAFTPSKDRSVSLSLNNSRVQDNLSSLTERTRISQTPQKQHNQDKSEFLIKIQDNPLQFTPEIIDKQAKKKRSQSVTKLPTSNDAQTAPENFQKVGTVSKLLESSKNKSKEDAYEAAMSFIMQAESRIKKEPHDISQNFEKTGLHHVVSMPTMSFKHEEGIRPVKINYGNPEAAIMIGPPAIKSQQRIKAPETYQRLEFNNRRKESADV